VRSPRRLLPVLGWCAATVTSVALASVAMLPVLRTATPDESALASVDQVRDAGEPERAPLPSVPPVPSATAPPPAKPSSPPPAASSSPPPAKSSSPSPSRGKVAPETTTTIEDGWTVTTDGEGRRSYVRSFRVDGGSTVIRMTAQRVKLVTATPSDGYSVQTVQNSPDNLAVYFNEVNHSFVIHAVWWNDKPFVEISEIGK
jgi:hypothetical protein